MRKFFLLIIVCIFLLAAGCLLTVYLLVSDLQKDSVRALAFEGESYLWTAGLLGAVRWHVSQRKIVGRDFRLDGVEHFLIAEDGQVWAYGTFEVWRFEAEEWVRIGDSQSLDGRIYSLTRVGNGDIWAGTSSGFRYWDGNAQSWKDSTIREPGQVVVEDNQGALWFGLENGVMRLNGNERMHWTDIDGIGIDYNQVRSLLVGSDDTIWAGTSKGVGRWNGHEWRYWEHLGYPDPDGLSVYKLFEASNGIIWAATSEGVAKWDGETWTTYQSLPLGVIFDFLEARDGALWVAGRRGLFRWDGTKWHEYGIAEGITDASLSHLAQGPEGTLYLSTKSGLYRYLPRLDQWEQW